MTIPILITGSMSLTTIINAQNNPPVISWFVFQNPVAALILIIALLAEVNRAPFDLPEAEQELTAGYHTEYSGMKFALFFMAEYIAMSSVSVVAIALFFGGYHFILVDQVPILGPVVFFVKVVLFLMAMIWIRATLPRIRYDRLMSLGWKVLFPVALLAAGWTAVAAVLGDAFPDPKVMGFPLVYLVSSAVFAVLIIGFLVVVLRGPSETEKRGDVVVLEKRGIGYATLNAIGAVLSIPVMMVSGSQRQVKNLQSVLKNEDPRK